MLLTGPFVFPPGTGPGNLQHPEVVFLQPARHQYVDRCRQDQSTKRWGRESPEEGKYTNSPNSAMAVSSLLSRADLSTSLPHPALSLFLSPRPRTARSTQFSTCVLTGTYRSLTGAGQKGLSRGHAISGFPSAKSRDSTCLAPFTKHFTEA